MLQVVVLLTQPYKFTNNGTLITSWDSTGLGDSEFVFNLENLPKWASAAFQSIKEQDGEWIVGYSTRISKVLHKEIVLDHYVILQSGMEVFVQLRVVKNDSGSEAMPTIFQTLDKSERKFAEDVDMVERDLKNLKNIMEEDEKVSDRSVHFCFPTSISLS